MNTSFVVSQLGARMHYGVPRLLARAGRLERLYTDICATKGWPRILGALPPAILPGALRRLRGRIPLEVSPARIRTFPAIGLASTAARMLDASRSADTQAALRAGERFSAAVVRAGFGNASGFYGISGECLEQLQAARRRGMITAVEQIIAPRRMVDRLVEQEAERHRDWQSALGPDPFAQAFAEREQAEWWNADLVVCPSDFVRDGVIEAGGPAERCVVVPYGVDGRFVIPLRVQRLEGPVRILTVGAAGLRKGTPYVLEAARRLGGLAEFRLAGPVPLAEPIRRRLRESVELTGPVPRAEIAAHYEWADLFLLPSVCEGSATVIYEALAAGLPVITTPNAGSVVRDGVEGFICPAADADAICERIERIARNPKLRADMAHAAMLRSKDYDLAGYGRRLLDALDRCEMNARSTGSQVA